MSLNRTRIAAYLLSGAMAVSGFGMPVNAASSTAAAAKKKLALPTAGITYALSTKKVSLRDVKAKLESEGKTVKTSAKTSAAASAKTKSSKAGLLASLSSSKASTVPDLTEAVDGILDTKLTPVQEKEKSLVESVEQQTGVEADISAATTIAATAVSVVVGGANNVQIMESKVARDTMALKAAGIDVPEDAGSTQADTAEDVPSADASSDGSAAAETAASTEETSEAASPDSSASGGEALVVSTASDFVNVRAQANTDSEIIGKLYSNSVGKVLEDDGDWVKISSGDVTGYVKKEYVASGARAQELASAVATQKATVTTTTLRVRAAASTDSDVITLIGQGQELNIIAEEGNFYKVNTPDGEGYISKDFADVEEVYPEAVSKEEEEKKSREQVAADEARRKAEEAKKQAEEAKKAAAQAKSDAAKKKAQEAAEAAQKQAEAAAQAAADAQTAADQAAAAQEESGSSSSGSSQSADGQSLGSQVVSYATQFIGNPYVWGGSSLTNGTDCSGFTMAVYSHFGVSLPHYDAAQRACGTAVNSLAEAMPGDIICYSGHVGIYIGNGQIVHASNPSVGITISSATYRSILAIRRIFN